MLSKKLIYTITFFLPLFASAQFYHSMSKSAFFAESSEARWYNLDTHIYQVCGDKTVLNRSEAVNLVEIKPNCSYILPTPPKQVLRINLKYEDSKIVPLNELFVTIGNGQGTWSEERLIYDESVKDYILSNISSEPQWVKISWMPKKKVSKNKKTFLSVFSFRDEKVPRSDPFATQISHATEFYSKKSICKDKVKECQCRLRDKNEMNRSKSYDSFRLFNQKDSQINWEVDQKNDYWATIYGPVKLRLDSRFLVNPKEQARSHKYFYNIYLNTAPFLTVEHESLLINSKPFYKHNTPHLLSERKSYYVDIPPGCHRMRVESIEPIYLRVLAESHDFLFETINKSIPPIIQNKNLPLRWSTVEGQKIKDSIKTFSGYKEPLNWLSHKYLYSWINHWENQVGWGSSVLDSSTRLEKRFSDFARDSDLIKNVYNHFKEIFPRFTGVPVEQKYINPITLLAQHEDYPPALRVLSDGYIDKFGKVSQKPFFRLKTGKKNYLKFKVPKTPFPVEMKILVLSEKVKNGKHFYVQFEKSKPFLVEVSNIIDFGPLFKRWSSTQVSQYVHQKKFFKEPLYPLKTNPHQEFIFPSHETSQVYLRVPAGVENINIWTDDDKESWIHPAVKMQNLRFLSEQEFQYIDNVVSQDKMWVWFLNAIKRSSFGYGKNEKTLLQVMSQKFKTIDIKARLELENIWLPIIRGLQSRSENIKSIIGKKIVRSHVGFTETKKLKNRLKREKNIFKKLSILSRLEGSVNEEERDQAIILKSDLLEKSGKSRLNSRYLTYHYYYTIKNPKNKETIYKKLYKNLVKLDQLSKLKVLLSNELIHRPNYQSLQNFIELIFREGNYQDSFTLTYLLPQTLRNTNVTLVSSMNLRWWGYYNKAINQINNKSIQSYWRNILKKHKDLNYDNDERLRLANQLIWGQPNSALMSNWSKQNVDNTEFGVYKGIPWDVHKSAGFFRILSDNEKVFVRPLATAQQPVEAEVYGHADLQIEIRPIHKLNSKDSLDGWVNIEHQGKVFRWPIIDNKRSTGLSIFSENKKVVGLSTRLSLKLGLGLNKLKVWSTDFDIIVDLKIKRPLYSTSPLPLLTRSAAEAFLNMDSHPQCKPKKPHQLTYILQDYSDFYEFLARKPQNYSKCNESEGLCSRLEKSKTIGKYIKEWNASKLPPPGVVKRFYEVDSPENKIDIDFDFKMTEFLLKSEKRQGKDTLYYGVKARLFYEKQKNKIRQYSPAWSRLQGLTGWKMVDDVVQSVGVISTKSKGWQATNENQKMTAALSGLLKPEEQLLGGSWSLKIHTDSETSSSLRITSELVEPAYLRSTGATVKYGVFEKFSKKLKLSNKNTKKVFYANIPSGKNLFFMTLLNPKKGQYIKVTVQDKVNGEYVYIIPETQKDYFVTTKDKPIIVSQRGPTLLRLDYKVGEEDFQKYIEVSKKQQIIKIRPLKGEKSSKVRIFKLVSLKEDPYTTRPIIEIYKTGQLVNLESKKFREVDYDLSDELKLGGQEDGTWSLGLNQKGRFYSTNEPGDAQLKERFFEPHIQYRFFTERYHVYSMGGLFHRLREDGFNTSGFSGHIHGRWRPTLQTPPLGWWFKAKQYFQRVQGVSEDRFQESTHLSLGIGQWRQVIQWLTFRPSLELFFTRSSMDGLEGADRVEVDLDIYSGYKRDHQYGLKFGDRFVWQRWWDSTLEFSYSLWSNEQLSHKALDSIHLAGIWKQNWHHLYTSLSYGKSFYLKDLDRFEPSEQTKVLLKMGYDFWLPRKQRIELMASSEWRPEDEESIFWFGAKWHMGHGRGFKDYAPAETPFRALRSRLSPKYNIDILEYEK